MRRMSLTSVFWMSLVRSFHWHETVNEIVLDRDFVPLLCDIYGVMELCDIYGILVNDNNPVSLLYRIWLDHMVHKPYMSLSHAFTLLLLCLFRSLKALVLIHYNCMEKSERVTALQLYRCHRSNATLWRMCRGPSWVPAVMLPTSKQHTIICLIASVLSFCL